MPHRLLGLLALVCAAAGAEPKFVRRVIARMPGERIAGAALDGRTLLTWGDRLRSWSLPSPGRGRLLGKASRFRRAGCLFDVDSDGARDLVVLQGKSLVWLRSGVWQANEIDADIETPDLFAAVLDRHRGVLSVHKYGQVRFYEAPQNPFVRWPSRDLYSFYTPSRQAGLLLSDIDGDGRTDILCGNYWIRGPERFELPWHLFAIYTWSEQRDSATVRLALADVAGGPDPELIAAQAEMPRARLAWFEKPAEPKRQWVEHRLEASLARVNALAVADLDGNGANDIIAGEDNGPASRLIVFWNQGDGRFSAREIGGGEPVQAVFVLDRTLVVAGSSSVTLWESVTPVTEPRGGGVQP